MKNLKVTWGDFSLDDLIGPFLKESEDDSVLRSHTDVIKSSNQETGPGSKPARMAGLTSLESSCIDKEVDEDGKENPTRQAGVR